MGETKKTKKGAITEKDTWMLLERYSATTILALLKEVLQFSGLKIDWNALVRTTSTGITSAREYQTLWRHLAYRDSLLVKLEDGAVPLDDDSDLEFEVEAVPAITGEASLEASACVKALVSSRSVASHSIIKDPFAIINPGKPSRPWGADARVSVSVQKRLTQTGPSDETGSSSKKKKNKWTEEEDMELKAAVQKCGEGNWASILKQDFKHNRTASQLSQRWSTIRKKEPDLMPGGSKRSRSDECVATNKAATLALDMPIVRSASAIFPGSTQSNTQACSTLFSASKPPLPPNRSREPSILATPQKEASNPQKRPRTKKQIGPVMPSNPPLLPSACPKSSIQEVAVAAGGRIATPSTAASLLKAAQSRSVHIIPAGGAFVRSDGQSLPGTNMLPLGGNLSGKGRIGKPLLAPPRTGAGRPGIASPTMQSCQSTQLETKTGAQILKTQETAAAKIDRMTSEMHVGELLKIDYGGTDEIALRRPTSYGGKKGQSLYKGKNNSYAANVGGNVGILNSGTMTENCRKKRTGDRSMVDDASRIQIRNNRNTNVNAARVQMDSIGVSAGQTKEEPWWTDVPIHNVRKPR